MVEYLETTIFLHTKYPLMVLFVFWSDEFVENLCCSTIQSPILLYNYLQHYEWKWLIESRLWRAFVSHWINSQQCMQLLCYKLGIVLLAKNEKHYDGYNSILSECWSTVLAILVSAPYIGSVCSTWRWCQLHRICPREYGWKVEWFLKQK